MKRLLLFCVAVGVAVACYDDTDLREQIAANRQSIIDLQELIGEQEVTLPELKIENGYLYVSYDKGADWNAVGQVASSSEECLVESAVLEDDHIVLTLSDGTVFNVALYAGAQQEEGGVKIYYLEEIAKTKASVNALITEPCLVFPMITDIHYKSSAECPDLIDITMENMVALSKDIRFDFFACLGDITDGNLSQEKTETLVKHLYDQFLRVEAPFYPCIGNHDDNRYPAGSGNTFSHSQLHRIYMRNTLEVMFDQSSMCGTNYYKDFYGLGVRCVFLNANDNGEYGFADETCEWLENVVKTDYDIYVFSHISPVKAHQYNQTAHKNDERIVAALKGAPTFRMLFNGHSHFDSEFLAPFNDTTNPFLAYSINANKFANTEPTSKWPSQAVFPERELGTVSEDCFDIVVIRPKSGKVNTVRFGAGEDKEFNVFTGESVGESSSSMLPDEMVLTADFTAAWPFAEECVAVADQGGGREKYTYDYIYGSQTRALTFTLGSTSWAAGKEYSYESVPNSSDKALYFHGADGGIVLPGIPGMYLSNVSISLAHYAGTGIGVMYAIMKSDGGAKGNRKLSGYIKSGQECVFKLPVTDASPASLESEAGASYMIHVRDNGGYIGKIEAVYTKTKPVAAEDGLSPYKIGNAIGTDGVLFYISEDNLSGKVVYYKNASGSSKNVAFSSDAELVLDPAKSSLDDGQANVEYLKSIDPTLEKFPAAKACDDMDGDWYLPAVDELKTLLETYNGTTYEDATKEVKHTSLSGDEQGARECFDDILKNTLSGQALNLSYSSASGTSHWSSSLSASDGSKAQYLRWAALKTGSSALTSTGTHRIRCIKKVTFADL